MNFIFSFILHPSYIIFYPCSYLLFIPFFPLIHLSICDKKGGEYTREYTRVYCHFYMTHVHILRGINSTLCTFVGGESYKRDAYTKREKTFSLFCFGLYYTSCILHWLCVGHAFILMLLCFIGCMFG